jgi:DNA helicase-2/ATP-dependent DNA helicase PcrA
MRHIILGPPGTGKTTKLLDLVDEKIKEGVSLSKIGCFSFTRKSAEEAISRACIKFDLERQELPFFRTLHSLALRQLGLPKDSLMQRHYYKLFGEKVGIPLNGINLEDENGIVFSSDKEFLSHIDISRAKQISLKEQWAYNAKDMSWEKLDWIHRTYNDFKKTNEYYDYTDMLVKFVKEGVPPKLDFLFIDEAQDLSKLQWQAVEKLADTAKETYIAGDDDQAIFRWAGADIEHFINMKGEVHILKQSYRIPKSTHSFCVALSKRIKNRREKEYIPRDYEGELKFHNTFNMDVSQGEWLILATTNYLLDKVQTELIEQGVFFKRKNKLSIKNSIINGIYNWEDLRKGKKIIKDDVESIYDLMSSKIGVKHGFKNLNTLDDKQPVNLHNLIQNYGLLRKDEWYKALDLIPLIDRVYIRATLRRGAKLSKPKVRLSTIHGAKGSECQNVVLFTDLSREADKQYFINPDDQTRVMYVGATRAKEALHIIYPQTTRGFRL